MVRLMEMRHGKAGRFPIGAGAGLEELDQNPHALLARLREREAVSSLPALDGWLITRRDVAMQVMRDPETFTVDDPRFSTGQVVGSSMLTLDGEEHRRHREPFARPFRLAAVRERFTELVTQETERLIDAIEPAGRAELRRSLTGPLAVAIITNALGFKDADARAVLGWYERIVAAVTEITAGRPLNATGRAAYEALSAAITPALDREPAASLLAAAAGQAGGLERERVISNAAVLLFGGIETTDGMIANAVLHLLSHPGPHVCIGMHLARLEAHTAVEQLLCRLPAMRLDPARPPEPRGLVFRKPHELHVLWTPG